MARPVDNELERVSQQLLVQHGPDAHERGDVVRAEPGHDPVEQEQALMRERELSETVTPVPRNHLRGRVLSLYLLAFAGAAPIGGLLSGWLADIGGTELAFGVAGLAGLAMTLYGLNTLREGRFAPTPVLAPGTRR